MTELRELIGNTLIVMGVTGIVLSGGMLCWDCWRWFGNRQRRAAYEADRKKRFLERLDIVVKEMKIQDAAPEEASEEAPEAAPEAAPVSPKKKESASSEEEIESIYHPFRI
jgi:hypothetical protein